MKDTSAGARVRRALLRAVSLRGKGLHTGADVRAELRPLESGEGIRFVRTDLPGRPAIPLSLAHIASRPRRTALVKDGAEVQTIEHLLAVLCVLGIQDVEVALDGPEFPGLDGSALPIYQAVRDAGLADLDAPLKELQPGRPVAVSAGGACAVAMPFGGGLRVSYTLHYDHPRLRTQYVDLVVDEETFAGEIAPARTFVLEEEVEALRRAGLGKGATTRNTLVLGRDGIIDNELRFEDEFARHKVLDLIGDLYLTGCAVRAHVSASRAGHELNRELARALLEDSNPGMMKSDPSAPVPPEAAREEIVGPLDSRSIERILPHRYPFLLVDRVLELRPNRYVKGIKNVTYNEEFFRGHFPSRPVMPGVLQVEALAQLAGVLLLSSKENEGKLAYLLSLDKVKFRRTVVPGDQLLLEVEAKNVKKRTAEVAGRAYVDSALATEATIRFMMMEND